MAAGRSLRGGPPQFVNHAESWKQDRRSCEMPGLSDTAYDTAWVAAVPAIDNRRSSRFPSSLQWLVEHQLPDGSWGGVIRYEHDRVLCTLAALVPLAIFGRRAADRESVAAGIRYLWQRGHLLRTEPVQPVGFELLLPTLVERARQAGLCVPPHLDIYSAERDHKLRLIPPRVLYSSQTTVAHSLEFLGEGVDVAGLHAAQGANGAIGNSPAATAFFVAHANEPRAVEYLDDCLARSSGSAVTVLHPCETFELLWTAYHLYLGGTRAAWLLGSDDRSYLRAALEDGGVSLSRTFPTPDADDTAVALMLLRDVGEDVNAAVLQRFALPGGYFASYPHERHSSVGVNLHVLHALLRVPGFPDAPRAIERLLDYIEGEQVNGLYWLDKWHISPFYATAHALHVLYQLPSEYASRVGPMVERSWAWLRESQNENGSWGFYGEPTCEETAYALLALATVGPAHEDDRARAQCAAGLEYLSAAADAAEDGAEVLFPPLWVDKCLYTPTLVVRAVMDAARYACNRRWASALIASPHQAPSLWST
jgi:halimadienyl-diphosphate synthase